MNLWTASNSGKLTIFQLFPWCLVICFTVLSGALLTQRFEVPSGFAWVIALAVGVASFALYRLILCGLGKWLDREEAKKWKWQTEKRVYRVFVEGKFFPAEDNLYYECLICGNAIPSLSKNNNSCACRNITVNAFSGQVTIQNTEKIKLFSISK